MWGGCLGGWGEQKSSSSVSERGDGMAPTRQFSSPMCEEQAEGSFVPAACLEGEVWMVAVWRGAQNFSKSFLRRACRLPSSSDSL